MFISISYVVYVFLYNTIKWFGIGPRPMSACIDAMFNHVIREPCVC